MFDQLLHDLQSDEEPNNPFPLGRIQIPRGLENGDHFGLWPNTTRWNPLAGATNVRFHAGRRQDSDFRHTAR